jgi:hypothetical protein
LRSDDGIALDGDAIVEAVDGSFYLRSKVLAANVHHLTTADFSVLCFEGGPQNALCTAQPLEALWFEILAEDKPSLRLDAFDLPPLTATDVANREIVLALLDSLASDDPELNAKDAVKFLESPHILAQLFAHAMALRSEDSPDFIVDLRKIAEHLRHLVQEHSSSVSLCRIEKSHASLWSEVQGRDFAFLDGGVARVPGIARQEPLALRVGVYAVTPGETDLARRERWRMLSFLVSDAVDPRHGISQQTDRRRLLEAARYTFELITALQYLKEAPNTSALLIHGPLINQFAMYDEGPPNFIPALDERFLGRYGITRPDVLAEIESIPSTQPTGEPYWNHFMAVYPYVLKRLQTSPVPVVGVVERGGGRPVTDALLSALLEEKTIDKRYLDRITELLDRYDISDELLFGCFLREGEFVTPLSINKNYVRKSRDRWRPVVEQLPQPKSTMLKTDSTSFPFRVEMNDAASSEGPSILKLIYHTARLLPRYAFPVGLDIADKYAKVPDWIAKGISGELSSFVLRRALRTGNPHVVAQVRQLLSATPRDFFFRPQADF